MYKKEVANLLGAAWGSNDSIRGRLDREPWPLCRHN